MGWESAESSYRQKIQGCDDQQLKPCVLHFTAYYLHGKQENP